MFLWGRSKISRTGCDEIFRNKILDNDAPQKRSIREAIIRLLRINLCLRPLRKRPKQKSSCAAFLRKSKKEYYENLSVENIVT